MNVESKATLLVVDDDQSSLSSIQDVLVQEGYRVVTASSGTEALSQLSQQEPDLVLTDLRMREVDGMAVLSAMRNRNKEIPVIVMTAFTSPETAIEAIRNGAYDYLSKPFKLDQLRVKVQRALEQKQLLQENRILRNLVEEQQSNQAEIVGRTPEMVEIYKLIARVSPLPTTILIEGESGSGKEVIARLIHKSSSRPGPFLAINCGAITESLLETELFGHIKGSFTGATANKVGIFEAAQSGTVFLDEISNTSPTLQMKLLRVLEEREIVRVGSTETIPVDARVITATNQPLASLVKSGRFREDLYYRLKVVTIPLPALRDRRADIPLLLDHFVRKYAHASGKEIAIHESLYPLLSAYAWPGNVRELAHAIERAIALNSSGILTTEDFPDQRGVPGGDEASHPAPSARPLSQPWATLEEKEREYILEVLAAMDQNVTRTSEVLDIDRRTLYRILKRHQPETKSGE